MLFLMFSFKSKKRNALHANKVLKENVRMIEKPKAKNVIAAVKKVPPKQQVTVKKNIPKPVVKPEVKKTPPKEQVIAKKISSQKTLQKALPKIEEMPKTMSRESVAIVLPKNIEKLSVEEVELSCEEEKEDEQEYSTFYNDRLNSFIKHSLKLKQNPNIFVVIELTINKKGELANLKYISSSDVMSKEYVMENLPRSGYPSFFGEIANQSEYTLRYRITPKKL